MYLDDPAMTLPLVKDDNLTVSVEALDMLYTRIDDHKKHLQQQAKNSFIATAHHDLTASIEYLSGGR